MCPAPPARLFPERPSNLRFFVAVDPRQTVTARRPRRRQAMRAAAPLTLKTMAGAAAPGRPFDPLGVANICDVRLLREAELKHGRIAMLASVGFVVPDLGLRLPGVTLSSLDAHDALIAASPNGGAMGQILLFVSLLEARRC